MSPELPSDAQKFIKPRFFSLRPRSLEFITQYHPEVAKSFLEEIVEAQLLRAVDRGIVTEEQISEGMILVSRGFDFANSKHEGQNRLTGEPYIFHPARAAIRMASDRHITDDRLPVSIATMLNHDVLEDTDTLPSEMRDELGPDVTYGVQLLSKNIKAFDLSSYSRDHEIESIHAVDEDKRTIDQIGLLRWIEVQKGASKEELKQIFNDELSSAPDDVKRARGYDREDNLDTIPDLHVVPPRSTEDQAKVVKIRREAYQETYRYVLPIIASMGLAGATLYWRLRRAARNTK